MASFKQDSEEWQRLDWRLLQNSPITLYFQRPVLEADTAWFVAHGYRVLSLRAEERQSPDELLVELGKLLAFPDYYGRNLDAFNDCLSDVDVPDDGGLVVVLDQFDAFARLNPSFAQRVLDICANNSRRFLLTGLRFVVLVQSDDPRISFEPVGASPVMWNPQEWLNSKRGL
jgi:RNAse (barnase) inhibitor barstar